MVQLTAVALLLAACALGAQAATAAALRKLDTAPAPRSVPTPAPAPPAAPGLVALFPEDARAVGTPCGPLDADAATSCAWLPSPAGTQCCCRYRPGNPEATRYRKAKMTVPTHQFACLPSAIVIGAQKSGSSALLGYLLRHPAVLPSVSKEAHFFDRDPVYARGLPQYLGTMLNPLAEAPADEGFERPTAPPAGLSPAVLAPPFALPTASTADTAMGLPSEGTLAALGVGADYSGWESAAGLGAAVGRRMQVETTPAYLLGTSTAVKAGTVLPHAKLLVILRNPVDRAYSEWQMKRRRVEAQFHGDRPEHMDPLYAGAIAPCFAHPDRAVDYAAFMAKWEAGHRPPAAAAPGTRAPTDAVAKCLTNALQQDSRVAALLRRRGMLRSRVMPCLLNGHPPIAPLRSVLPDYQHDAPAGIPRMEGSGTKLAARLRTLLPALPPQVARATQDKQAGSAGSSAGGAQAAGMALPLPPHGRALAQAPWWRRLWGWATGAAPPAPAIVGWGEGTPAPWAPPVGAAQEGGEEEEEEPAPASARSLARFESDVATLPPVDLVRRCLAPPVVRTETVHSLGGLLEEASRISQECVRDGELAWGTSGCWVNGMNSNIVVDFVARGAYLPQLRAWHAVYGRDRVLVLAHEELLSADSRPATLRRVAAFLGLPPLPEEQEAAWASQEAMDAAFGVLFPTFEAKSGWRMKSEYPPLPKHVRRALGDLYAPMNRALYAYLGRDFGWEAANAAALAADGVE